MHSLSNHGRLNLPKLKKSLATQKSKCKARIFSCFFCYTRYTIGSAKKGQNDAIYKRTFYDFYDRHT